MTLINYPVNGDNIPSLIPGGNYKFNIRFFNNINETYLNLVLYASISNALNW